MTPGLAPAGSGPLLRKLSRQPVGEERLQGKHVAHTCCPLVMDLPRPSEDRQETARVIAAGPTQIIGVRKPLRTVRLGRRWCPRGQGVDDRVVDVKPSERSTHSVGPDGGQARPLRQTSREWGRQGLRGVPYRLGNETRDYVPLSEKRHPPRQVPSASAHRCPRLTVLTERCLVSARSSDVSPDQAQLLAHGVCSLPSHHATTTMPTRKGHANRAPAVFLEWFTASACPDHQSGFVELEPFNSSLDGAGNDPLHKVLLGEEKQHDDGNERD